MESGFINHHNGCSLRKHQTSKIGECCHMRRLEDVYAEIGSYVAHDVEGLLSSNIVLIGCIVLYSISSFVHGSEVAHNSKGAL